MKSYHLLVVGSALAGSTIAQEDVCTKDLCYRAMQATYFSGFLKPAAESFCSSVATVAATDRQPDPPMFVSFGCAANSNSDSHAHYVSVCSCFASSTTSSIPATSSTAAVSTAVSTTNSVAISTTSSAAISTTSSTVNTATSSTSVSSTASPTNPASSATSSSSASSSSTSAGSTSSSSSSSSATLAAISTASSTSPTATSTTGSSETGSSSLPGSKSGALAGVDASATQTTPSTTLATSSTTPTTTTSQYKLGEHRILTLSRKSSTKSTNAPTTAQANATSAYPTSSASAVPTEPCTIAKEYWRNQTGHSLRTVPARVAYDCLKSVPLHKDEALQLVDAIVPYLEWQTDAAYKANPPKDYYYPANDMFAALSQVRQNLVDNVYSGEYDFQVDLYTQVFGKSHDGHLSFYPDLLTKVFDWGRDISLVSVSEDGTSLPVIKVFTDVRDDVTSSAVTHINGEEASKYLSELVDTVTLNQDPDAAYNSLFFEYAKYGLGQGLGYFSSGGRGRYVYIGDNTTLTFANGSETTITNHANVRSSLASITDGESMYATFCSSASGATSSSEKQVSSSSSSANGNGLVDGQPKPVISSSDGLVSCYFLDGQEYDNVVVLAVPSFSTNTPAEFQSVVSQCFKSALESGRTKLVVDFTSNGGGLILLGYDLFRQLFPKTQEDGFSRWKETDTFRAISEIVSDSVANIDPYTSSDAELVEYASLWFNYRYDYNINGTHFQSFDAKFASHEFQDTKYTSLMRWNLNNNLTTTNDTYGLGIEISGYGSLANLSQPFAAEDIVLVYDGFCASTCTTVSEMLRVQGKVKSIAFGGRPQEGPIQGVGGVKGSQVLDWSSIYGYAVDNLPRATTDEQRTALNRLSSLPLNRSSGATCNTRDNILRDNIEDGLPAQYVREEADCRLYYTPDMFRNMSSVWKAAASSAFNGASCVAGGISQSAKRTPPSRLDEIVRRRAAAANANRISKGHYDFHAIEKRLQGADLDKFMSKFDYHVLE